jgi:hypothetical protein
MSKNRSQNWIESYRNAGCSLFQFEPEERAEYPGRTDMLVGYTVVPELWQRAHGDVPVKTADLAKSGEIFAYVKIDGRQGLEGSEFQDREDIEDALNEALTDAGMGCVIGAGTGLHYSYVDLALREWEQGSKLVRQVLRSGRIPKRCWLIPFDDDRASEAIGIWEDSPELPHG